ncbi:MAG TPA: VIT1/CCC1 transporter family protein [Candidatus Limnocylindria bacterium]|nr:VIT1/CCC1 transporter family protein [Candidatus Limnocylindria bacterium]
MTSPTLQLTADERARSLANLKLERDAIELYDSLAAIEKDAKRAAAFKRIAANERRHAEIWATRLEQSGATVPPISRPRARVRMIIGLARLLGPERVADLVVALEGDEEAAYEEQMTPEAEAIAADEREHAAIWDEIKNPNMSAARRRRRRPAEEALHKSGRSGTLRAAVFGANDGLVSNLSLVMGVAGAAADNHFIVLAGSAGLLAGAFSMAAGEYISMQSQRELFENQIAIEREEMRVMPDVEEEELAEIYRAKGLSDDDSKKIAKKLMEDPREALDTKVREELGLDPTELGSSWGAAIYSFVAFGIGAFVPLLPFLLTSGQIAFVAALGLSFAALFAVGAGVSLVTGRGFLFSGVRQVLIGAAAAAVTYGVGSIIGANV